MDTYNSLLAELKEITAKYKENPTEELLTKAKEIDAKLKEIDKATQELYLSNKR